MDRSRDMRPPDELVQRCREGVTAADLRAAVREEFKENEDLPNTTNPDDWAKRAGKKGARIVYVKSLVGHASRRTGHRGGRVSAHSAAGRRRPEAGDGAPPPTKWRVTT